MIAPAGRLLSSSSAVNGFAFLFNSKVNHDACVEHLTHPRLDLNVPIMARHDHRLHTDLSVASQLAAKVHDRRNHKPHVFRVEAVKIEGRDRDNGRKAITEEILQYRQYTRPVSRYMQSV